MEVAAVGARAQAGKDRQPLAQGTQSPAAVTQIAARIKGNAAEPGRELGLSRNVEIFSASVQHTSCATSSASARVPVSCQGEPMDAVIVSLQQKPERVAIASGGCGDQVAIGKIDGESHERAAR